MKRSLSTTQETKAQNFPKNISGGTTPEVPIRVVPDANVLFSDPFVRGIGPEAITAARKFVDISLAISDVTCDELRNIVKTQIDNTVREIEKLSKQAESLELKTGLKPFTLGHASRRAAMAWEKRMVFLRKTLPFLPYPQVNSVDLARRSIDRYRPFLEGDKGLRDYLLWTSVLTAAQNDQCIYVIVSNDHGFYVDKSDALHPNLEVELASKGISGRIVMRRSFPQVLDEFVKPFLKPEENVEVAIQSGKIPDFTGRDDIVGMAIYEYLLKTEIPEDWITKRDALSAEVDVVEDATMTELSSVLNLDGRVLVTSQWVATVVVDLSFPGYQRDSESVIVEFTIESLVNPTTLEVESHEVSGMSLSGWYDEETGERIPL